VLLAAPTWHAPVFQLISQVALRKRGSWSLRHSLPWFERPRPSGAPLVRRAPLTCGRILAAWMTFQESTLPSPSRPWTSRDPRVSALDACNNDVAIGPRSRRNGPQAMRPGVPRLCKVCRRPVENPIVGNSVAAAAFRGDATDCRSAGRCFASYVAH